MCRKYLLVYCLIIFVLGCSEEKKGMVRISTSQPDAQIFINDARKGSSPSEKGQTFAIKLGEGEHVIRAYSNIDERFEWIGEKTIFVSQDSLQTVSITLEKKPSAQLFSDINQGKHIPEMVQLPPGSFKMGCTSSYNCRNDQKPIRVVNIGEFSISKYEVTFDEWDLCYELGGCSYYPSDQGYGRGGRPVINVSYEDITNQFLPWLSQITSSSYRLPTEAEWEYAARSGKQTRYFWGNGTPNNQANCMNCRSKWDNKKSAPVGSFSPNRFGLFDMHGNVSEIVKDCYTKNYGNAPTDGSSYSSNNCQYRVSRGGSYLSSTKQITSSYRGANSDDTRTRETGFRVVKE